MQDPDKRMRREISAIVSDHGVPSDTDSAYTLSERLHPVVQKYRRDYYRRDVDQMGADMNALGLEVAPAPMRDYPPSATYDGVIRAIGMGKKPSNIELELVDDETRRMMKKSVPAFAYPDHLGVRDKVVARMSSTLLRHARKAGRDAVRDTARLGRVRDAALKRPAGQRVGYARVMTGRETCAFCAMLASRGPVYSEDTATRRKDGGRYHDGCDCIAVLVVEGQPWPGQKEYERLQEQWGTATEDLSGSDMWEAWRLHYESGIPDVTLRAPRRDRALMRTAPYFRNEPLPPTEDMAKHSIWGWRRGNGPITSTTPRIGHSHDSVRKSGTFFPASWSDQDISDAIVATMEDPQFVRENGDKRYAVREVDGVYVEVAWKRKEGKSTVHSAYPMFGDGVEGYARGERVPLEKPHSERLGNYDRPGPAE